MGLLEKNGFLKKEIFFGNKVVVPESFNFYKLLN